MTREQAARVVDSLLHDAASRSGIGNAMEEVDAEVLHELRETWVGLVMAGGNGKKPWFVDHE